MARTRSVLLLLFIVMHRVLAAGSAGPKPNVWGFRGILPGTCKHDGTCHVVLDHLRVTAAPPRGLSLPSCSAGALMATAEYELALRLRPGGTAVAAATLAPPEVDVDDIVAAAAGRANARDFVVREVRARLAQRLRRRALIEGAPSQPRRL